MDTLRALGELAEAPGSEQVRLARLLELPGEPDRTDYTALFIVQLYPYASVYLSNDGQRLVEVQDHLSTICNAYSSLAVPFRCAFLWDHMISWMLPFAVRARELGNPTYRAWAMMLLDGLEAEVGRVGSAERLPMALRNASGLDSLALDDVVAALFAPATSGIILTRSDLGRCARELNLMIRVADRRFTLRSMFEQDRSRVQAWLVHEAKRQADLFAGVPAVFAPIASHWEKRSLQTADVLECMIVQKVST